jgi:hypothetical protein
MNFEERKEKQKKKNKSIWSLHFLSEGPITITNIFYPSRITGNRLRPTQIAHMGGPLLGPQKMTHM